MKLNQILTIVALVLVIVTSSTKRIDLSIFFLVWAVYFKASEAVILLNREDEKLDK